MTANTINITIDEVERMLALEVSFWRVVPAWIAMNDGGATPDKASDNDIRHCTDISWHTCMAYPKMFR